MDFEENSQNQFAKLVLERVSYSFGIAEKDFVKDSCKYHEYVLPRQTAMWFMRLFNIPFPVIGSYFAKGHSTVIYSIKQVNNLIETDKNFRDKIEGLKKVILPEPKKVMESADYEKKRTIMTFEYLVKYYLS